MNPKEILAAAPDAIAMSMGVRVIAAHPLAEQLADNPLSKIAYAAGTQLRPAQTSEPEIAIIGRGMGTPEFSKALADAAQTLVRQRFNLQAAHRAFCGEIEVKDFRPTSATNVDVNLSLALVGEGLRFAQGTATATTGAGNEVAVRTYGRLLNFSRQLIVNDQIGAIKEVIANVGFAAARTEAALTCAALESDSPLDDGEVPFHADHGNLIAEAFGAETLAQAISALRMQTTSAGNLADLAAAHLVVAPNIEFSARKLNHESGIGLTVTALADLPPGRWYLTAAAELKPTIATVSLRGSKPVRVEQKARGADNANFDGASVLVSADLGAALVNRIGIVRGGA